MAALTSKRAVKVITATTIDLAATASTQFYQGAAVGLDTATGLVDNMQASTTLIPIGRVVRDKLTGSGAQTLSVKLDKELKAVYYANSGSQALAASDVGALVFFEDDQTVSKTDQGGSLSLAGRMWRFDSAKGILVENTI